MEWIVVDDGTDCVQDCFDSHYPDVKYRRIETKMRLGEKRNFMHSQAKGEIIVYMDDDDYYPPTRVEHAVQQLLLHPSILLAGSSVMNIYIRNQLYEFGPFGENHATAATFAFRRELLETCTYDENAILAEEKQFTKNYSVPMIQLDPLQTILVIAHAHNSLDRSLLLDDIDTRPWEETRIKRKGQGEECNIDVFFRGNKEMAMFYKFGVHYVLPYYDVGRPQQNNAEIVQESQRVLLSQQRRKLEAEWTQKMAKVEMEVEKREILLKQKEELIQLLKLKLLKQNTCKV